MIYNNSFNLNNTALRITVKRATMKKAFLISLFLMSFLNSYSSDKKDLLNLIDKYRASCDEMIVGDTITYLPLKNERNGKMIEKFGDKPIQYVITKIDKESHRKKALTWRNEWTIQEVGSNNRVKIVIFVGNEEALRKEYVSYTWDDEACYYDLPFFHNYEQWKKELIGVSFTHPLIKATYEIVDASIRNDQFVNVVNSIDKKQRTYPLEFVEKYCFKEDLSGAFRTYLAKVEKPENPEIKYGQIEVVKDSVEKYSYEDEIMKITIHGDATKFNFILENKTTYTLSFPWERAIFVDMLGYTSKVMHNGIKYSEKESSLPASTIIRGAKLKDVAIPTENVNYSESLKEWTVGSMYPQEPTDELYKVQLMLPIQVKDVVNDYIFSFDIRYVPNHPERFKNSDFFLKKK